MNVHIPRNDHENCNFADKVANGAHPGVDPCLGLERRQPLHLRGQQPAVQTGVPRAAMPSPYHPAPQPAAQQQFQVGLEEDLYHRHASLQRPHRQGHDSQNAKRQSTEINKNS